MREDAGSGRAEPSPHPRRTRRPRGARATPSRSARRRAPGRPRPGPTATSATVAPAIAGGRMRRNGGSESARQTRVAAIATIVPRSSSPVHPSIADGQSASARPAATAIVASARRRSQTRRAAKPTSSTSGRNRLHLDARESLAAIPSSSSDHQPRIAATTAGHMSSRRGAARSGAPTARVAKTSSSGAVAGADQPSVAASAANPSATRNQTCHTCSAPIGHTTMSVVAIAPMSAGEPRHPQLDGDLADELRPRAEADDGHRSGDRDERHGLEVLHAEDPERLVDRIGERRVPRAPPPRRPPPREDECARGRRAVTAARSATPRTIASAGSPIVPRNGLGAAEASTMNE